MVGADEGTPVTTAREEILARVRAANGPARTAVEVPRGYRRTGSLSPDARLDLLQGRLVDYRATVTRCPASDVPAAVGAALSAVLAEGARVLLAPGLPAGWAAGEPDDGAMDAAGLDGFAAVVTCCTAACAETGTIVLDGSPDQGRRAITLVPDVHVCVVRAEQVVETVPELLARLDPARPLTFVSGPSATSDIELERVEGVHGPRTLHVVLVTG